MKNSILKTTIQLLTISLVAFFTNSCKKDSMNNLQGIYNIEVKVTVRKFTLRNAHSDSISLVHQSIGKHIVIENDLTNICCAGSPVVYCPRKYKLQGVEIIKDNGNYFIKGLDVEVGSNKPLQYLPLQINKDEVNYDLNKDALSERLFHFGFHVSPDNAGRYPKTLQWFSLQLKKQDDRTLKGTWVFLDRWYECSRLEISNKSFEETSMCEFAEVTFTKIKD